MTHIVVVQHLDLAVAEELFEQADRCFPSTHYSYPTMNAYSINRSI